MLRRAIRTLIADQGGAVAATYALALFGLIAMAGVAFDFARLAAVDTELQNAADQAALAAATQLDQTGGAIGRANGAVTNYLSNSGSSVVNRTLLANDKAGSAISGVTLTYYTSYDRATDAFGAATTTDATARVVEVKINARQAYFALTAIVGAVAGKSLTASAVATLEPGTCKQPPMMICGPAGSTFPSSADAGKGMLLQPGSAGTWAPGTFGYLVTNDTKGAAQLKKALGGNASIDECTSSGTMQAQQGNIASAADYLNTRFDIYDNPLKSSDCTAGGDYCPAANVRRDLVTREVYSFKNQSKAPTRPACGASAPQGASKQTTELVPVPKASGQEGYPRDLCHQTGSSNSTGTCTGGNIGDGVWDLTGYYAAHPYLPAGLTTRYQIYKWERDNPSTALASRLVNGSDTVVSGGCNKGGNNCSDYTWTNYCSYPSPVNASPATTAKDRRVLTVAVADCSADLGSNTYRTGRWADVFLTEPAVARDPSDGAPYYTGKTQIYVEVIGPATTPGNENAFQYYARNKAVLLR